MIPDKPFESDGCSVIGPIARFFDYHNKKVKECCIEHDRVYHRGGPISEKRLADARFRHCLIVKAGLSQRMAALMWLGVAVGGFIPHPKFRWGFGWKFPRYKA